jgi:hypothetical protein
VSRRAGFLGRPGKRAAIIERMSVRDHAAIEAVDDPAA